MKIRTGFVSNSSSSSFLIYGTVIDLNDVRKLKPELSSERASSVLYEFAEELLKESDLIFDIPPYSDSLYIGKSWDDVKNDETGAQFKESIEKEITRLLGKSYTCHTYSEAWYDG